MTVRIKSGLHYLVTGVQAYFTANAIDSVVSFGFKERSKQINQGPGRANRVVFLPGDPKSGAGGVYGPVRGPGMREFYAASDVNHLQPIAQARSIGDWERAIFISTWAYDGSAAEDEFVQSDALDELHEWVRRAVSYVGLANIEWIDMTYTLPAVRSFGLELLSRMTLQEPNYDIPTEVAYPVAPKVSKDPPT